MYWPLQVQKRVSSKLFVLHMGKVYDWQVLFSSLSIYNYLRCSNKSSLVQLVPLENLEQLFFVIKVFLDRPSPFYFHRPTCQLRHLLPKFALKTYSLNISCVNRNENFPEKETIFESRIQKHNRFKTCSCCYFVLVL